MRIMTLTPVIYAYQEPLPLLVLHSCILASAITLIMDHGESTCTHNTFDVQILRALPPIVFQMILLICLTRFIRVPWMVLHILTALPAAALSMMIVHVYTIHLMRRSLETMPSIVSRLTLITLLTHLIREPSMALLVYIQVPAVALSKFVRIKVVMIVIAHVRTTLPMYRSLEA